MKKNTWLKIVLSIVVLELLIGGVLFAYKKINQKDEGSVSLKNKTIQSLYQKINHEDLEILDVMSEDAILYYGYWNVEKKETINCDVVEQSEELSDYTCDGITSFIKTSDLKKAIQEVYGKGIQVSMKSFPINKQSYGFYDQVNDGIVVFTKENATDPINLKLKKAVKNEEEVMLTTQVLDGIYGTVLSTYRYTFEKEKGKYYLKKKEKVTEE